MLSPLTDHQRVPRDLRQNLIFRRKLIESAHIRPAFRAGLKHICASDVLFFINAFVWQINFLKEDGEQAGPFITWDFQDDAVVGEGGILWCMENKESLLIEKSREMGASWLCLLVFLWRFLFHKNVNFLCISRSEEAVEKRGDPKALFTKIDFVLSYLPRWLRPKIKRGKRLFVNLDLGSTITGEASTGLAGVGGRATAMFIDEFSVIREDAEVRAFSASHTNCRIFNGTHRGLDTEMYRLAITPEIKKLRFHWSQHPDKVAGLYQSDHVPVVIDKQFAYPEDFQFVRDGKPIGGPHPGLRSPWYDRKCVDIGNEAAIAMDLDINPARSVAGFFDSLMIHQLIREFCQAPWWEGDLEYDRERGLPVKLVRQQGGRIKLWCVLDALGQPPIDKYGAGVDSSTGTGASNSCISIVSATTGEKVCEVADPHLGVVDSAEFFVALCRMFKDHHGAPPLMGWQIQGPGAKYKIRAVDELGYMHVYRRYDDFHLQKKESDRVGIDAKATTTRPMLDEYASSLQRREFLNRSEVALQECLAWKWNDRGEPEWAGQMPNDPSGAKDNHGDRSVADMIANRMIRTLGTPHQQAKKKQSPQVLSPAWRYEYHEKQLRMLDDEEIEV